ncbi:hypothetical protein [Flavobacterium psychrotolerans]|nr:hypothetical protein [Flavobacterium psychrotolerans]
MITKESEKMFYEYEEILKKNGIVNVKDLLDDEYIIEPKSEYNFYRNENCIILYLVKSESRRKLTVGYNLNNWVRSALFNKKQLLELSVSVSKYGDNYAYFINEDKSIGFAIGWNFSHKTPNIPINSYNAARISYNIFKRILEGEIFTVGIVESDIHKDLFDNTNTKFSISVDDLKIEQYPNKREDESINDLPF